MKLLGFKNIIPEIKNSHNRSNNRLDSTRKKGQLIYRNTKYPIWSTEREEKKRWTYTKSQRLWENTKGFHVTCSSSLREERVEVGTEKSISRNNVKNFPKCDEICKVKELMILTNPKYEAKYI